MEQEWFSIREFAIYAGLHYNTVRRAILSGRIQAVDHGTRSKKFWRIHKSEIERMAIFNLREIFGNEKGRKILDEGSKSDSLPLSDHHGRGAL